jgi:hypothetical protein
MKNTMLLLVVVAALIMTAETHGAVTVFGTEADYNAATGPQIFLIDFDGNPEGGAYVDGGSFDPAVTFGSPEASDPTLVLWNSDAMSDAGSTTATNNVGPVDGVFTDPVYAFALLFSSSGEPQTVSLYDEGDVLIDTVASNPSGFFGVVSDTPIKKFILDNGEFWKEPEEEFWPDRFFIDDFRANEPPIQAEKELTLIIPDGGDPIEIPDPPDLPDVPMHTRIYFTMVITVTNNSPGAIEGVIVKDNIAGDLELISAGGIIPTGPSTKKKKDNSEVLVTPVGDVTVQWSGNTEKVHLSWDVGDMDPGASASLTVVVATDLNQGQGKKAEGKNEYTSPGEHTLNSGATAKGLIGDVEVNHKSNSISVNVVEPVAIP